MFRRVASFLGYTFLSLIAAVLVFKGFKFGPTIDLEPLAQNVVFDEPVHLHFFGKDQNEKILVSEKTGRVKWVTRISNRSEGTVLDIADQVYSSTNEVGLLSTVLDPQYPERPYLYTFYSRSEPNKVSRLSRFEMDTDSFIAKKDTELTLLEVKKWRDNHNGGLIRFEKPGVMWLSIGDSEYSLDVGEQIHRKEILHGSIIRIDVSNSTKENPYAIPADNPYAKTGGNVRPEIWAHGFRNPWRFSYDAKTNSLIVADVGTESREEVNRVVAGGHYGWPVLEGDLCQNVDFASCDSNEFTAALGTFDHSITRAVTGAAIYRGELLKDFKDRVVFSDYMRGLFSFTPTESGSVTKPRLDLYKWPTATGPNQGDTILISSLQVGPDNELYVVNKKGTLARIVPITFWKKVRGVLYAMLNFR